MQTIDFKDLPKYQQKFGLPIRVIPGFQNAMYIKKSPESLNINLDTLPDTPAANAVKAIDDLRKTQTGGIVIGEPLLNPTILAHEKGHSQDTTLLSSLAPKTETFWRKYNMPLVGTLGAILAGIIKPEYAPHAAAINLGAQALSTIPVLYSEYKASQIAKKIYPEAEQKILDDMYDSYLKEVLGRRLLIPGVAHGAHLGIAKLLGD